MPSGSFTGTGSSDWFQIAKGAPIRMDFSGTATVQIQQRLENGNALTVESVTSDYAENWNAQSAVIRLNCSAHTDDVYYEFG